MNWTIKHEKTRRAEELMQDKEILQTMSFLGSIGLQSTKYYDDVWKVKFVLQEYQRYFHITGNSEAYTDLTKRIENVLVPWEYGNNDSEEGFGIFHLISGFYYYDGIFTGYVTQKGKELILKLKEVKNND